MKRILPLFLCFIFCLQCGSDNNPAGPEPGTEPAPSHTPIGEQRIYAVKKIEDARMELLVSDPDTIRFDSILEFTTDILVPDDYTLYYHLPTDMLILWTPYQTYFLDAADHTLLNTLSTADLTGLPASGPDYETAQIIPCHWSDSRVTIFSDGVYIVNLGNFCVEKRIMCTYNTYPGLEFISSKAISPDQHELYIQVRKITGAIDNWRTEIRKIDLFSGSVQMLKSFDSGMLASMSILCTEDYILRYRKLEKTIEKYSREGFTHIEDLTLNSSLNLEESLVEGNTALSVGVNSSRLYSVDFTTNDITKILQIPEYFTGESAIIETYSGRKYLLLHERFGSNSYIVNVITGEIELHVDDESIRQLFLIER